MTETLRRRLPRVILALLVLAGIAAFVFFGPSETEVLSYGAAWKAAVRENLVLAVLIFFVAEVVLVALSVPLATLLSVLAGVLFGRWLGTLVVSFASTFGAWLAMLTARYLLRDSIRRRLESRPRWKRAIEVFDRGIERDGWFYLLLVRLTPVFPFFLINVLAGLTRIRSWTYWWTTQLGMLPMTFVVVSAGAEVGEAESFRDLVSFERLWPLGLLVVVAIALRVIAGQYLRRKSPC
jgi:uncharacterized membrane protein YdjX (TVP38/TMEM64 family)